MDSAIEGLYGKHCLQSIGKIMATKYGTAQNDSSLHKVVIAGQIFGNLPDIKTTELWEGGFVLQADKRRNEKKDGTLKNYRIGQILTTPEWTDPEKYWGKELKLDTSLRGVGKIIIRPMETIKELKMKTYILAGIIFAESLNQIGNRELWSGQIFMTPASVFTDKKNFTGGMTVDYMLTDPSVFNGENYAQKRIDCEDNKPILESYLY